MRRQVRWVIILSWIGAMTWLFSTKVIPSYFQFPDRGYAQLLDSLDENENSAAWRVYWNEQPVGRARVLLQNHPDGSATITSVVDFERLPVVEIAESFLGVMIRLLPTDVLDQREMRLDASIQTDLTFDAYRHLVDLESTAGLNSQNPLLYVRGTRRGDRLHITSRLGGNASPSSDIVYRTEVALPEDGFQIDSLTPVPRLEHLAVGQSWLERSWSPLSGVERWETVRATVEAIEPTLWNGEEHEAFRVRLQSENVGSLSVTHRPVGYLWVLRDGEVVRQQMKLASVSFTFERIE